jgi:hypothetical protein
LIHGFLWLDVCIVNGGIRSCGIQGAIGVLHISRLLLVLPLFLLLLIHSKLSLLLVLQDHARYHENDSKCKDHNHHDNDNRDSFLVPIFKLLVSGFCITKCGNGQVAGVVTRSSACFGGDSELIDGIFIEVENFFTN